VRPADAFARPVKSNPSDPDAPRIAIVVGGLGIGSTNTSDAIKRLPGRSPSHSCLTAATSNGR
jgi:polysaccharide deacetylase 2 family uncharacterized protein YibQ